MRGAASAMTCAAWALLGACSSVAAPGEDDGGELPDIAADRGDAYRPRDDAGGIGDALPELATFPPACGDGLVDPGEECDDGNRENGDECDWACHPGPGSFDYLPPDPTVPPVALSGAPEVVVDESEGLSGAWAVAWGPGIYGVAYEVDRPEPSIRFRLLDPEGRTIAGPTDLPEVPGGRISTLIGDAEGFRLIRSAERAGFLTVIGPEGAPVGSTVEIRRFPYEVEDAAVFGAALAPDRLYLRWSVNDVDWTSYSLFECRRPSGEGLGLAAAFPDGMDLSAGSMAPVALPEGMAAVIGARVVIFDTAMDLVGWSGVIPVMPGRGSPDALVPTESGMVALWLHLPDGGVTYDLWAAGFDTTGELNAPPHVVHEALHGIGCNDGIAAASGSTAVAVATVNGTDGYCDDNRALVLDTDRWGNPRSELIEIPFEGSVVNGAGQFTIVAADAGWSVWAIVDDPPDRRRWMVFQRLVTDPP